MSSIAPMPRMRRHKRRLVDDGTDLSIAVRDYIESTVTLQARQGRSDTGRSSNAPAMGGGGSVKGDTTSDDSDTTSTETSETSTSASSTRARATPTTTSTTSSAARTTTSATSSSSDLVDQILSSLAAATTSTTSTTSSSRVSSTTSSTSTTSSSSTTTSSSSSETSTSTSSSSIKPITATMIVTSTPTRTQASVASATQSTKSVTSAAGPIIGIVAGSLVGIVVLSGLIGFLFKKYNKKSDPYEGNPFDRDAFQRHSTMIPDSFDSDDGHNGGLDGMSPEMSEHHQQFNNAAAFNGPQYESGISAGVMASMAGAGLASAGAGSAMAHNEGGPRPPTMFARHAQHQQQQQQVPQVGGYYKDGDYSHMSNVSPSQDYGVAPPSAAFAPNGFQHGGFMEDPYSSAQHQGRSISPVPQLPPLAAFGSDPYSTAGVGRGQTYGQQGAGNVNNPYAHLDRAQPGQYVSDAKTRSSGSGSIRSTSSHGSQHDQRHASVAAAEALAAGLAHQSSLNRSASNYRTKEMPAPAYSEMEKQDFGTQGRPGSSEGRSGTPDLPNVQTHNPFDPSSAHHQQQYLSQASPNHHNSRQLSVRNLVPNNRGLSAGQRPISTASSFADDEDAYGGVY